MLPSPKEFALLLSKSLLPEEVKEIILEKLPTLSKEQINAIYNFFQEEQDKIKRTKQQFESKMELAQMKFEHELSSLNNL